MFSVVFFGWFGACVCMLYLESKLGRGKKDSLFVHRTQKRVNSLIKAHVFVLLLWCLFYIFLV